MLYFIYEHISSRIIAFIDTVSDKTEIARGYDIYTADTNLDIFSMMPGETDFEEIDDADTDI